jgi:hypothetical protein
VSFPDSLRLLARRWLLVLTVLVLTYVAATAAWIKLPASYQAEAEVLFLAPTQQATDVAGGNPWLVFDNSYGITADVVRREMLSQQTGSQLRAAGSASDYAITFVPDTSGPLLDITVTGAEADDVMTSLDKLLELLPSTLQDLQRTQGAPADTWIRSLVVTRSDTADLVLKGKIREVGAIAVLGLVLAFSLPFVMRRVRPSDDGAELEGPDPTLEPPADGPSERESESPAGSDSATPPWLTSSAPDDLHARYADAWVEGERHVESHP